MNEKFFDLNREKQDRIINAALEIFAQNGYHHASTDTIVKNAGISKGLLFHYFGSKIDLFTFLFDYSVKYMIFEYDRVIHKNETNYFSICKDLEKAKLNVLRNYPYMWQFIQAGIHEDTIEAASRIEESKEIYLKTIDSYTAQASMGTVRPELTEATIKNLIRYAVDGLTADQMKDDCYQPEMLFEQICDYIDSIQTMATKNMQ